MLGLAVGLGLVAAAVFASAVLLAYHRGQYWQRPLLGLSMLICPIIAIVFACRSKKNGWIRVAIGVLIAFFGTMGLAAIYSMVMPVAYFAIRTCSFLHETPSDFWKWFRDHSLDLSHSPPLLNPYYDDMEYRIHRVDPRLSCIIGETS